MTKHQAILDRDNLEFKEKLLALLNSPWPCREDVDENTAAAAQVLSQQLRNWNSWK